MKITIFKKIGITLLTVTIKLNWIIYSSRFKQDITYIHLFFQFLKNAGNFLRNSVGLKVAREPLDLEKN